MTQHQVVDASTKCSKELTITNVHRAKYRVTTARRTDLMGNSDIHRKISHPVGFWHWEQIWMVTQAPDENTGSRTRRPHYKDRFVYATLHFNKQCRVPSYAQAPLIFRLTPLILHEPAIVASRVTVDDETPVALGDLRWSV